MALHDQREVIQDIRRSKRKHYTCPSNLGSDADSSNSRDESQSIFSSQASNGPMLDEQIDLTLQLTESVWVQCDKPECQKWRRIPADESKILDDVWYCDMNSDIKRNTCSAPEEDHALYDKMAKKAGIKYVMSAFDVGSLVWAKMAGYCSWPALITQDPDLGIHVTQDLDGDPHSYHVEFLGKPHTHSWVTAKSVDVYGYKKPPSTLGYSTTVPGKSKTGIKGRRGKVKVSSKYESKTKTSYKRTKIDDVVIEADFLLHMKYKERLEYSVFRYMPEEENGEIILKCTKEPASKKKGRRKISSTSVTGNTQCKLTIPLKTKKESVNISMINFDMTNKSAACVNQPFTLDSPDQFSQSKLKYMNTLADKSKEEKFRIDIDMYRKNEAAFEHDARRFMTRNGCQIKSTPVWHNVPITLFQLYLSVMERGGFLQVTARKQWAHIYRELTEQHTVTNGAPAKKYYQQNLYPFELYITGKDYQHSFKYKKKRTSTKTTETTVSKSPVSVKPDILYKTVDSTELQKENKETEDQSSVTQDIERILESLKEEDEASSFHDWYQQRYGVKFHDDTLTSPSQAKIPSEFAASQTKEMFDEITDHSDDESELSDIDKKILHEMKALQEDIYQS
ncbi:AT-rich interactive domain-containing protein 1B [Mactra antiquata]